jgi:hypothetical protein
MKRCFIVPSASSRNRRVVDGFAQKRSPAVWSYRATSAVGFGGRGQRPPCIEGDATLKLPCGQTVPMPSGFDKKSRTAVGQPRTCLGFRLGSVRNVDRPSTADPRGATPDRRQALSAGSPALFLSIRRLTTGRSGPRASPHQGRAEQIGDLGFRDFATKVPVHDHLFTLGPPLSNPPQPRNVLVVLSLPVMLVVVGLGASVPPVVKSIGLSLARRRPAGASGAPKGLP